jgi:hypothetical protein
MAQTNHKLTEDFETRELMIRGVTYRLKELSASEYDGIIKLATGPDDNAELNTVLRLMAVKAIIEPKLTSSELEAKAYPVYAKLLQTVNAMHFTPIEDEVQGDEPPNA